MPEPSTALGAGVVMALIGVITLLIKQRRNGHRAVDGDEKRIDSEVQRRVAIHDLRNAIQNLVSSDTLLRGLIETTVADFEKFQGETRAWQKETWDKLEAITLKLETYPFRREGQRGPA